MPPELVFDRGFGDRFVSNMAGNVMGLDVSGGIQYAIAHRRWSWWVTFDDINSFERSRRPDCRKSDWMRLGLSSWFALNSGSMRED